MNRPSALRQQFVLWGLILGFWSLLVLAFAGQVVLSTDRGWTEALVGSLRVWLPWAILPPFIVWLSSRFPLERKYLPVSIPVHVVACILALLFYEFVAPPLGGPRPRERRFGPPNDPSEGLPNDRFPPDGLPPKGRPLHPGPFGPSGGVGPGRPPLGPLGPSRAPFVTALISHAAFNVPFYWIIVSLVHALTYQRRSQERESKAIELEARLAEAKLQALQMQLHPHFLFNTLNAISTLVHKDPQAADEMIANLSELLRATLDTADQEIPLHQELSFLDRYLEIQQVRFGERLRIEKQIDAATLQARVPTLILQPLVENAIRHGLEPNPGLGVVTLVASRTGDVLHLAVRDNGAGPKSSPKPAEGIGLANTRVRLLELYGNGARVVFHSPAEGGFEVRLEIPFCEECCRASAQPSP